MRLIDADKLIKTYEKETGYTWNAKGILECPKCFIDNAPTVDLTKNQAYDKGFITAMRLYSRPQGEWYENIPKDCLKARHGDYVIYKVDFLLDNLAREVNIMEGARKMRGNKE